MPVYEFVCRDCEKRFEVVRPVSEVKASVTCPGCRSRNVERVWSTIYTVTAKKS